MAAPEAIENANRHEPWAQQKCEWKQGEPGGRTEPWPSQRCDEITPPRARLPFPHQPLCRIGATRQGFPTARLLLRSQRSALTGPAPMQGIPEMREWQASFIPQEANRTTIQQYSGVSSYLRATSGKRFQINRLPEM